MECYIRNLDDYGYLVIGDRWFQLAEIHVIDMTTPDIVVLRMTNRDENIMDEEAEMLRTFLGKAEAGLL